MIKVLEGLLDRILADSVPVPESGCLLWTGSCNSRGYASISVWNKRHYVHRIMWEISHGPIPPGLDVCHKCDVRSCIEPSHLFLGTRKENMQDAKRKGRTLTGLKNHFGKLSDSQVLEIRQLHASGIRQHVLAKNFGVSRPHISEIVNLKARPNN